MSMKHAAYRAILSGVRGFGPHRFFRSPLVKRLLWDTAPRQSLLVAECDSERFVVAAADQIIGQALFQQNQPFDFAKLERVVRLLADAGRRPRTLLDIGANIGTICIPAVGRGLFERAIAVEPEPLNFSLLKANIELNRVAARVQAHNLALGDRDGATLRFELSPYNFGDHRVSRGDDVTGEGREIIAVPSQTLDSLLAADAPGAGGTDPADTLLWMDVQGFEGHVLAGAPGLLARRIPLAIEFWPHGLANAGGAGLLAEAIARAGYQRVVDLSGDGDRPLPLAPETLDAIARRLPPRVGQTDLLLM